MSYILWIGSILSEGTTLSNPAASPAANRWQMGLLHGLARLGERVVVLSHVPEQLWPRGRMLVSGDDAPGVEFEVMNLDYVNAPYARGHSLQSTYLKAFERTCRTHGLPKCVFTYNANRQNVSVGLRAKSKGVGWFCVVADVPGDADEYAAHNARIRQATGRVFLSWHSYVAFPIGPGLHLDGGVEAIFFDPESVYSAKESCAILYSGAMSKWGGVKLLLKAFRLVARPDARLWLCGKGLDGEDLRLAQNDPRITYFGCVSQEKLDELCAGASVFANPRPVFIPENKHNFPSKILNYLSHGKPIVSTWTDGFSPHYCGVLTSAADDPRSFAEALNSALEWDESQRRAYARRAREFLLRSKTWAIQAQRLLNWTEQVIRKTRSPGRATRDTWSVR